MRFIVKRYNKELDCHDCYLPDGQPGTWRIDLFTDAEIPGFDRESIVGKAVELDRLSCFLSLAYGVRVCEETGEAES